MKERPILFSATMVRAILDCRKTVTRRVSGLQVINAEPDRYQFLGMVSGPGTSHTAFHDKDTGAQVLVRNPYGQPGDRLWVRETFWKDESGFKPTLLLGAKARVHLEYDADLKDHDRDELRSTQYRCKPSIHMPRWASRITLEVTGVRVERLQDISDAQAEAEGIHRLSIGSGYQDRFSAEPLAWADVVESDAGREDPCRAFRDLWESINGAGSWNANPWVWVVDFKRITMR